MNAGAESNRKPQRLAGWHYAVLLLAIVVSWLLMKATGRFELDLEPDSASYLEFDWSSWHSIFSGIRTPGYPLFIEVVERLSSREAIPYAQWGIGILAGLMFGYGLLRVGFESRSAVVCCAVLFFSRSLWDMSSTVASDSLAISLAILAMGCFLVTMIERPVLWAWGLLAVLTMAAYLVRPAFLFMLVLWPTLGPWIHLWVYRRSWITTFRRLLVYSALTFGCFFGYCGLRMMVVGEFGFVSFAGYNLIGISGQYLKEDEVERLPEDLQELARRMIANRVHIDDYSPPDTFETMVFLYNATIWKTAVPAAESLYGNDTVQVNQKLKELAAELIRMHPQEYRRWLVSNAKYDLDQVMTLTISDLGVRLSLVLFFVTAVVSLIWPKCGRFRLSSQGTRSDQVWFEFQWLFWMAIVFALGRDFW